MRCAQILGEDFGEPGCEYGRGNLGFRPAGEAEGVVGEGEVVDNEHGGEIGGGAGVDGEEGVHNERLGWYFGEEEIGLMGNFREMGWNGMDGVGVELRSMSMSTGTKSCFEYWASSIQMLLGLSM